MGVPTILYRAEEVYSRDFATMVIDIDIIELAIIKETSFYYFVKPIYFGKPKKIDKKSLKYAQLTKEDAVKDLIRRRRKNLYWLNFKEDLAEQTIKIAEFKLKQMEEK